MNQKEKLDFVSMFRNAPCITNSKQWDAIINDMAPDFDCDTESIAGQTFLYREQNGGIVPVAYTIDSVSTYTILAARVANSIVVDSPLDDTQFMPIWDTDCFNKTPHSGDVMPIGAEVEICNFVSNGHQVRICGCLDDAFTVRIWGEHRVRMEPYRMLDESIYDEMEDVFNDILSELRESGIEMEDVTWHADWCPSRNYVTGELGAGFFIHSNYEMDGYPFGFGWEQNKKPVSDLGLDFESESESEDENQHQSVTINIYL